MAAPERRYGGLTLGGILVIAGIIVIVIWSFWIGLIIALIGLVAFGGFASGKWYLALSRRPPPSRSFGHGPKRQRSVLMAVPLERREAGCHHRSLLNGRLVAVLEVAQ